MQVLPRVHMLSFKADPIPVEPKLYTVTLNAQHNMQVLIWHCAIAAFDEEGARSRAALDLKEKNGALYNQGMQLGGWVVQSMIELSTAKIDSLLTEAAGKRSEIEVQKEKDEINKLMQTIVDTAYYGLRRRYYTERRPEGKRKYT